MSELFNLWYYAAKCNGLGDATWLSIHIVASRTQHETFVLHFRSDMAAIYLKNREIAGIKLENFTGNAHSWTVGALERRSFGLCFAS